MRILIQRVLQASVSVDSQIVGQIGQGLLVFLGVHKNDSQDSIHPLVNKLVNLRIFSDADDKMNLSVKEVGGGVLVVSQFTLYGNCQTGRRPDFMDSAPSQHAQKMYDQFVMELQKEISCVRTGRFGAKMAVSLINDGPVTFIIEK